MSRARPPTITRSRLDNGIRLLVAPLVDRARTHVAVHLLGGPVHEDDHTWGLSHLVEHMVFRGTDRHNDVSDVTRAADDFGGDLGAATWRDRVSYDTRVDTDRLGDALGLLGGVLAAPRFSSLAVERSIVQEEIADLVDDEGNELDAENAVFSRVFAGDRLARSIEGTPQTVRSFDRRAVRAFHARAYRGDAIVVSVAGPVAPRRVLELARRALGRVPSGPPLPIGVAPRARRPRRAEVIRLDAQQTTVRLAFRAPGRSHVDAAAVQTLARVLDDGPASRLQQRLVDARGLAYSVWAFADPYLDGTLFELGGTVRHDRCGELVRALVRELKEIVAHGVGRAEVVRVGARHRRDMREVLDDPAALADEMGRRELHGAPLDPRAAPTELEGVSTRNVTRVARALFGRDNARLVLTGMPSRREVRQACDAADRLPTRPPL